MVEHSHPEPKSCATCGRALEAAIVELLAARPASSTICPSEAARRVALPADADDNADDGSWRELMEPARAAARRLVAEGRAVVKQRGRVVDPSTAKGPIRIARGPAWDDRATW